jgi:hypothetical protein
MSREDLLKDDDDDEPDDSDVGEPTNGDGDAAADGDEDDEDDDEDEDEDEDRVGAIYDAEVSIESFNDIKVQFSALGLIEKGTKRRPGSDTNTYWLLTDRGHQQMLRLRTIRKSPIVLDEADEEQAPDREQPRG